MIFDVGNLLTLPSQGVVKGYHEFCRSNSMCHIDCRKSPPTIRVNSFFWQSIAWYLDEKIVSSIIDGVYDAVKVKQSQYTINTKIPIYKTEMYCMTSMIDIIVHPRIRRLDMEQLPRILRTQVTAKLQVKIYVFHIILNDFMGNICLIL